jgi:GTP:adenosylcobinamide-phosphate guanylyltransferase
MPDRIPAVVLAGAPAEPDMAARYAVEYRADIPIAGRTMLRRVVDALVASPSVEGIYVIGRTDPGGVSMIEPRESLIENLIAGVGAVSSDSHVLVVTSDIPMVTDAAITGFIGQCGDMSADLYYPIIPKDVNDRRFPGMHRTYVRLAEGTFTGGNAFLLSRRFVTENADVLRETVRVRKQPMKMARIIGIGVLIRAVIAQKVWPGAIGLRQLERAVGRILKCTVKALPVPYPELGADVDSLEHVEALLASEGELR